MYKRQIVNNSYTGLSLESSGVHDVFNNIIWNNGKRNDGSGANYRAVNVASLGNFTSDYNCIQEQSGANTIYVGYVGAMSWQQWRKYQSGVFDAHSTTNPPLFSGTGSSTDAGYYELSKDSAAVDVGLNEKSSEAKDFKGVPRISGLVIDLGALERLQSLTPVENLKILPTGP